MKPHATQLPQSPANAEPTPARALATLDDFFERGDHYAVLNRALPLINMQDSEEANLRFLSEAAQTHAALLAVKSFVALGLIGPARELLTAPSSPLASIPEFQPLDEQLSSIPSGRLPWEPMKARFERNVAQLYGRHPQLKQHDAAFRAVADELELYWSSDNNIHVSRPLDARRRVWLPGLYDVSRIACEVRLPHDQRGHFCQPYVITGDHLGRLFQRVLDDTDKMLLSFSPRIYLVEPDPASFALSLYLEEDIAGWCHDRVSIFVGKDCVPQFESHLLAHPDRMPPDFCLRLPFAAGDVSGQVIEAIQHVTKDSNERVRASMARLASHYDGLGTGYWSGRMADATPLRILGITSRFTTVLQYSMRDIKAAFERMGHEFHILMEPTDHDLPTAISNTACIERIKPDLIFIIDHHRREYLQTMPTGMPFIGWVQDALPNLTCVEAGRSLGPLDFYIAADPDELARAYAYPRERGLSWMLATNDRLYDMTRLPDEALSPYRCDFSFVSNQSTLPQTFHEQYVSANAGKLGAAKVFDYLFERLRRITIENPQASGSIVAGELIADMQRDIGLAPASAAHGDHICRTYIHALAELFFRQETLAWVADYCDRTGRTLHLYGHGWDQHPRFARYARGVIENGEPLRALYQASAVNLQIIGSGAVHQRLLDGLAAGGFFLVRETPIDRVHEACERLLALVDAGAIEMDQAYDAKEHPEIARAIQAVSLLIGARPIEGNIFISRAEVETIRSAHGMRTKRFAGAVFDADHDRVSFASREQFEQKAEAFLSDADARRTVLMAMRERVIERFTYDALARDVLAFLRDRLPRHAARHA